MNRIRVVSLLTGTLAFPLIFVILFLYRPYNLLVFTTFIIGFLIQNSINIIKQLYSKQYGIQYSSNKVKKVEFILTTVLDLYMIFGGGLAIYLSTQNPNAFNKNTADLILSSYLILYGISNLTIAKINEDNFTIYRVWLELKGIFSLLLGSIALIMTLFYNAEVLFLFIGGLILAASSNMVFAIKGRKPIVVGNDELNNENEIYKK